MDLRSPNPYWLLKNGLISNYPSLTQNEKTELVVMGAGITGALCAWHLVNAGFRVIVCDKRHAGMGSTAASTALLQYEIDTPLHELIDKVGETNAVRSYELCSYAIEAVEKICRKFKGNAGFTYRPSLQYASFKKHVPDLEKEFRLRKKHGFKVSWWEPDKFHDTMGFEAPAAIYSQLGAEVDAYQLTHHLLQSCIRKGARVFDNTAVTKINYHKKSVELLTEQGYYLTARHLIIAGGYESQNYIPKKVETLHSTYAMVSEPMPDQDFWFRNCLIWETAEPYLYLRTTKDKRVLIGGLDDDFYSPEKRDANIQSKSKQLLAQFKKKFPAIPFKIDFQWAGTFASTKDGLPYIGSIPQRPNTSFALGFGGNGITFSLLAAEQITAALCKKPHPDMRIFSFNR
ncbi:NAD(P)/FAD-dependent oxidoreductase [Flavihumibacter sp. UBA7668]|uniref:NAD(P)/FAD-dependent oxidoreductase n=1 Tax=Flavihumibacter sp. UBA7668 TaxID=1946542 RepID=UPI0025C4AB14|nr:FAD-dependent oxidoreductase [Flavihumibacter sp. UBA7668]